MTCTVQHGTCWSACLDAAASEVRKALYDKAMQRVDQRAALLGLDAAHGAGAVLGRGRDPAA